MIVFDQVQLSFWEAIRLQKAQVREHRRWQRRECEARSDEGEQRRTTGFHLLGGSQDVQIDLQETSTEHFLKLHQFTIARFTEVTVVADAAGRPQLTGCLQCHSESWTNPTQLTCVEKKVTYLHRSYSRVSSCLLPDPDPVQDLPRSTR